MIFYILCLLALSTNALAHQSIESMVEERLTNELNDATIATALITILLEDFLTWKAPIIAIKEIDTIVAYAL